MKKIIDIRVDPKEELKKLISAKSSLFDPKKQDDLRNYVLSSKVAKTVLIAPIFPYDRFEEIKNQENLSEIEHAKLNNISQVLEVAYYKQKKSTSEGTNNDQEDNEAGAEEIEDDSEGEDDGGSGAALLKEKLKVHTFGPEIAAIYHRALESRPTVLIVHNTTVVLKDKTTTAWDNTKEKIKTVLNAMGFEGVFIALDYAADKNPIVKFCLKCVGSAIVPVFVAYMFISTALRIMQNPFKHVANWLAKEFDFKSNESEAVAE